MHSSSGMGLSCPQSISQSRIPIMLSTLLSKIGKSIHFILNYLIFIASALTRMEKQFYLFQKMIKIVRALDKYLQFSVISSFPSRNTVFQYGRLLLNGLGSRIHRCSKMQVYPKFLKNSITKHGRNFVVKT